MYFSKIYTVGPPISISIIARMSSKLGYILTETRSRGPIIGHYFFNMRNIWKTGPDSLTIAMEQNVQFLVGIMYHEKFQLDQSQNGRPCGHFRSTHFPVNAIHSTFLYISLKNSYHISISLIAHMSLKLGKICTESRSWRQKIIGHYFCNTCMRNMWKTRPDS